MVDYQIAERVPHILKYMGSKREILDFIVGTLIDENIDNRLICDLFAGTSVVTGVLKNVCNVHNNDIQSYSAVLANAYFSDCNQIDVKQDISYIRGLASSHVSNLIEVCPELIVNYKEVNSLTDFTKIEAKQSKMIDDNFSGLDYYLFTKTYSGTYWSFEQCLWIDALRRTADLVNDPNLSNIIMASLMFAMSYTSQSTGHYAQYRDANNVESMKDILIYRQKSVWVNFKRKFEELTQNKSRVNYKLTTSSLDFIDCLNIIPNEVIVYADPPYAPVHYSRFYHALETLVKYDYPKVYYKGRYRDDRHQSPFCQRGQVKKAFKSLFGKILEKRATLVLSYSSTGMISLSEIFKIAEKELGNSYRKIVKEANHVHSTMGRTDTKEQAVKEYLIIFRAE